MQLSRRTFGAVSAGALAHSVLATGSVKAAPSERVNLCVVGIRGRGSGLAQNFAKLPNAQVTHICDVNESLLGPFAKTIGDIQQVAPKPVQDLRKVLEDKSVDAIVVATPDHWHALHTIAALKAGAHVFAVHAGFLADVPVSQLEIGRAHV